MPAVGVSTPLIRDAPSAEPKVRVVPVVISCAVCAISVLNFSMLVPFFPEAAKRHGCTPTVTGMLFGLHQAVALLVTCGTVGCGTVGGSLGYGYGYTTHSNES